MNHKTFLSDLCTSLPEVNGAFLFTPQSGVIAQQLDQLIGDFNPLGIGRKITAIAATASDHLDSITQIEVNIDTLILSGRQLPDRNWLFLLHKPELSSGMIRMALQMALNNSGQESDDTERNLDEPAAEEMVEETDEEVAGDEAPTAEEEIQFDTEALMAPESPIAKHLQILQDEFANFIGPAAVPVFHELLNTWCQGHTPALDTMKDLIPLIEKEIDDPEDLKIFQTNIKDLIPQE